MQKYAKSSWISKLHLHLAKNQAFYRSRSGYFAFYFFKKSQEKRLTLSAWLYFKKWIRFIFYCQWKQKNIATVKQKSGKICNHFCFILQKWYFFNKKNLKKWNFSGITIRFFEVFWKKHCVFVLFMVRWVHKNILCRNVRLFLSQIFHKYLGGNINVIR